MTTTVSCATATDLTRASVLDVTRSWIGTPYHHQASALGTGTDCVGLVRGVYRTPYGREAEALPGYSRDWAEATGDETLIDAARRHLVEIDPMTAGPTDVLVFRYRPRMAAKHTGILGCSPSPRPSRGEGWGEGRQQLPAPILSMHNLTLIHALEGAPVSEVPFNDWWRRRIAAAFSFPGISD